MTVVAFSPDGKTIMTGCEDGRSGSGTRPPGRPRPTHAAIRRGRCRGFSPDGKSFVAGCDIGSARCGTWRPRTPLGQPFPHPGCISAVAFSPDGKTLLTGCEDGMARLWDVEKRTLRTVPPPPSRLGLCVAFSPDGKTVLTGSREDNTARLWDAATGMPLGPPIRTSSRSWPWPSAPTARLFLTGSYDDAARLFRNVPELPDDLERVATWVEVLTGLTLDAEPGHDPGPRQRGLAGASRTAGATRQPAGNGGRAEA